MAIRFDSDNREIYIVDTTLRDGEQTAGVVFANEEKVVIADMLSDLGVDQLEVGIPTMGGDEKKAIKQIVKRIFKARRVKIVFINLRSSNGFIDGSSKI